MRPRPTPRPHPPVALRHRFLLSLRSPGTSTPSHPYRRRAGPSRPVSTPGGGPECPGGGATACRPWATRISRTLLRQGRLLGTRPGRQAPSVLEARGGSPELLGRLRQLQGADPFENPTRGRTWRGIGHNPQPTRPPDLPGARATTTPGPTRRATGQAANPPVPLTDRSSHPGPVSWYGNVGIAPGRPGHRSGGADPSRFPEGPVPRRRVL